MQRFWEIDFIRGIAVVLMILFNYAFAANFFGLFSLAGSSFLFWFVFPRLVGGLFIFIVGVSLVISYNRAKRKKINLARKYVSRGAKIFFLGLLVTAATFLFFPGLTVFFGILHLIGISIIFSFPFVERKTAAAFVGAVIIIGGIFAPLFRVSFPWLVWLGFAPAGFQTLDYFPLLPWLGVAMVGSFFGNILYGKGRRFALADRSKSPLVRQISFLGRNSLAIYFLHIPVLIAILYAVGLPVL